MTIDLDNGRAVYATYYSDEAPENGSQPMTNGQGCIHYERDRATLSGTFTLAELRDRAGGVPIVKIWNVSIADLCRVDDFPVAVQAGQLLRNGGTLADVPVLA